MTNAADILRDEVILATLDNEENGHVFRIVRRVAREGEDQVRMVETAGDALVKNWGSHVNLKQAFKFAASRGFTDHVCTNCDQWRHAAKDCANECSRRGFTHY